MSNCPHCGRPLTNGKCRACIGKASRAKGNRGQREACKVLTDAGLDCVVSGISQRRAWDKGVPDLTVTIRDRRPNQDLHDANGNVTAEWNCIDILHGEVKCRADLPAWLWGRGPKRKPSAAWWEWLEGVRCLECGGDGGWVAPCESCDNTGWVSHRHDFAMIRRTARRGEAAYDWLVLTQKWGPHTLPGWDRAIDETLHILFHPRDATEEHNSIVVIPADKWARAAGGLK